jgi:Mrp family chromosome partitioning ATPase
VSAIDQAFIRAYEIDEPVASTTHVAAPAAQPVRVTPAASAPSVVSVVESAVAQPQGRGAGFIAPAATQPLAAPIVQPVAAPAIVHEPVAAPAVAAQAPSGGAGKRRPLSTFAQSTPTVEGRFKPALEVDSFRWPTVDEQLMFRCRAQFQPALSAILAADEDGRSLIGIGSQGPGAGGTTLVCCLARLIVETGKTVAVVDANFLKPGLASHLGLAAAVGWEDVLAGNVSLAEGVVHSLSDRLSLLPLATGGVGAASRLESIHASVTAGVLRYHYDIVLFDLGVVSERLQGPIARRVIQQCRLDGALVASVRGAAQPQQILQSAPELATICLGVVENQLRAA